MDDFLTLLCFPGGSEVKASACNIGEMGSISGLGKSPGEGNGNLLQYSCLENPMERGAWQATVQGSQKIDHNYITTTTSTTLLFFSFKLFILFWFYN